MIQSRSLVKGLVACGVTLAMVTSLVAQSATEGVAKVVKMKGSARYTTAGNSWQQLKVGSLIKSGTILQTSADKGSYVDLALGDSDVSAFAAPREVSATPSTASGGAAVGYNNKSEQNTIRLAENTVLGIDKIAITQTGSDVVTDTQLDLKAGRIMGNVKKMAAASKYEIKVPTGVAGVRGTFYDISAEGVTRVVTGSVVVAYVSPDGTVVTQVVSGGQQFDARTGQLSPIPPDVMASLKPIVPTGTTAATAVTTFSTPPEVIYVSPVR